MTEFAKTVSFYIDGKVRGKGRPRFARMGKFVKTYTDKDTLSYENYIKFLFKRVHPDPILEEVFNGEVHISITAFFALPKSAKKTLRQQVESGVLPYCKKKPDLDNVLKCVCDSLNGIAYKDDSNVVVAKMCKKWSSRDQVFVQIGWVRDS